MSESPVDPRAATPLPSTPPGVLAWLPWLAALAFALVAGFVGQLYLVSKSQIVALREQKALAEIDAQSLRQQMEAERILAARRLADASADPRSSVDPGSLTFLSLRPPSAAAAGAAATVVLTPSGRRGLLAAHGLPPLANGREYQVWLLSHAEGAPLCIGTFSGEGTNGEVRIPLTFKQPPERTASFAVRIGNRTSPPVADGAVLLTGP